MAANSSSPPPVLPVEEAVEHAAETGHVPNNTAAEVAGHGVEACSYLLAVDVEMNTVPGYSIADWGTGYGDLVLKPDFATLRRIPWLPGTAHVLADAHWPDGGPVAVAPRQILAAQIARLTERGLVAYAATELEFLVFEDSYRQAWAGGYRGLTPGTDYNADYGLVAGTRLEPLLRDSGLFLQRHHSSSQTEGLRFFAQSRLGVAWLPHTLVREDLASRRLVRAGGQRFDVPLRYTLIRRRLPLPGEAERLWTFLGELARPAPRYAVVGAAS